MLFKRVSKKRHYLSMVIFSFLVAVLFYLSINPLDIEKVFGIDMSKAVGLTLGVAENPYNKVALQLQQKNELLNEREKNLDKIQQDLAKSNRKANLLLFAMGVFVALLFLLVLLNFYLDYRRRKTDQAKK